MVCFQLLWWTLHARSKSEWGLEKFQNTPTPIQFQSLLSRKQNLSSAPCLLRTLRRQIIHHSRWHSGAWSSHILDRGLHYRQSLQLGRSSAVPALCQHRAVALLEFTFSPPATSAPVERIFSQGGLFVRPHRARISDKLLCQLMLAKCNRDVC